MGRDFFTTDTRRFHDCVMSWSICVDGLGRGVGTESVPSWLRFGQFAVGNGLSFWVRSRTAVDVLIGPSRGLLRESRAGLPADRAHWAQDVGSRDRESMALARPEAYSASGFCKERR